MDYYMKRALEGRLAELKSEVASTKLTKEDEAYKVFWKDEIEYIERELAKNK